MLRVIEIQRARECIVASCALDDLRFHVTVWYEDVDLDALAARHGAELLDRIAFHVAMFQLNAVVSLRPDVIELGPWARFATPAFVALWQTVWKNVWGQWRWEHQLPDYAGPAFVDVPASVAPARPGAVERGDVDWLVFCGGGKDSLVALELFQRGGLRFATLGYSHSIYGTAAPQHALLERVAGATARVRAERQWIVDDFLDAPVVALRPSLGVRSVLAAETPASVFAALPIALARGYRGLVVAHEHSANTGNLVWDATGEEVNHQWGKGWEAEQLLDAYVQRELVAGVRYFSVLQPVHDEVIFELLARDAALAPTTHSCNVQKPWCGACAKCAYVWLQMAAHLPAEIVAKTFAGKGDLGERPENLIAFRELLGLAEHSPFECVGSPVEARLALAMVAARRPLGRQLTALAVEVGAIDVPELARPLLEVDERHGMPDEVAAVVMPQLREAAAKAKRRLGVE
jgi:hypothetical protein